MIMMMTKLIKRFRDDESGVISIELLLVIPMLVWALLSTWVYFDAYRAEAISTRAGLTIADVISRENTAVDETYLRNMRNLMRVLTEAEDNPAIRVTSFRYRATGDRYLVVWSASDGMGSDLTDADLESMRGQLPIMANGGRALLIETRTSYSAPFSIGLGPFLETNLDDLEFESYTVISPRFQPRVCFDPSPSIPNSGDELC